MKKITGFNKKGFGVIEILIGISLTAVILTAFLNLLIQTVKISRANIKELQAIMYLREMIEIARDLEKSNWPAFSSSSSCSSPSTCYPEIEDSQWVLTAGEELLEQGNFQRYLTIKNVYRDNNFEITESGGTEDQNTKKIVAKIYWQDGFSDREAGLEAYLYNYNF